MIAFDVHTKEKVKCQVHVWCSCSRFIMNKPAPFTQVWFDGSLQVHEGEGCSQNLKTIKQEKSITVVYFMRKGGFPPGRGKDCNQMGRLLRNICRSWGEVEETPGGYTGGHLPLPRAHMHVNTPPAGQTSVDLIKQCLVTL